METISLKLGDGILNEPQNNKPYEEAYEVYHALLETSQDSRFAEKISSSILKYPELQAKRFAQRALDTPKTLYDVQQHITKTTQDRDFGDLMAIKVTTAPTQELAQTLTQRILDPETDFSEKRLHTSHQLACVVGSFTTNFPLAIETGKQTLLEGTTPVQLDAFVNKQDQIMGRFIAEGETLETFARSKRKDQLTATLTLYRGLDPFLESSHVKEETKAKIRAIQQDILEGKIKVDFDQGIAEGTALTGGNLIQRTRRALSANVICTAAYYLPSVGFEYQGKFYTFDENNTIFLNPNFDLESPTQQMFLLHELLHAHQDMHTPEQETAQSAELGAYNESMEAMQGRIQSNSDLVIDDQLFIGWNERSSPEEKRRYILEHLKKGQSMGLNTATSLEQTIDDPHDTQGTTVDLKISVGEFMDTYSNFLKDKGLKEEEIEKEFDRLEEHKNIPHLLYFEEFFTPH